jgi:hypothetical protein
MVFEDFENSSLRIDFTQINGGFERTTEAAFQGSHSFVSTNTTDNSTSAIEFDIKTSGTLELHYKISSEENFDFGRILINGSQVLEVSGDKNFQLFSQQVAPNDTVRIEYDKDESISRNSDAFFIDNIDTPAPVQIDDISQYNKKKKLNVSSVNGTPTVDKAQPVVLKGNSFTGVDGFESGGSQLGWESLSNFSIDNNGEIFGDNSLKCTAASDRIQEGKILDTPISSDGKILEFFVKIDNQGSAGLDGTEIQLEGDQAKINLVNFQGDGDVDTDTSNQIGNWSPGEVYKVKATLNFPNSEYDIEIENIDSGETIGSSTNVGFATAGDNITRLNIVNDTQRDGITVNAFFDRLPYTAEAEKTTDAGGDVFVDFTNISDAQDIALYDQKGNLLDYEVESLDTFNETGVLWAYNSWVRDGSEQAQLAYGKNTANTDRQNPSLTWGNSPQNCSFAANLSGDLTDSARGGLNPTTNDNSGIFVPSQYAEGFDSPDDNRVRYKDSGGRFFDVSAANFTDSFDVEDFAPTGVDFSDTGDKMFVIGTGENNVNEYSLSTAFDISTANLTDGFDVSSQDSNPAGVVFTDVGDKMFVVGNENDSVYQYSLSINFDVSTASFTDSFDVSSQDGSPGSVAFSDTGDKMFVVGNDNDNVLEYSLSTTFDVSTASFTDSLDISGQDTNVTGVTFNNTGSKMFVSGSGNDNVYEYSLSTAFDVSTASFTDSFDVETQEGVPTDVVFSDTGGKMFVIGDGSNLLHEYEITLRPDLVEPSQVTLALWINYNQTPDSADGQNQNIAGSHRNNKAKTGGFAMVAFSNSDQIAFNTCDGTNNGGPRATLNDADYEGVDNFMVGTYDGSTAKLFKDAQEIASGSAPSINNSTQPFTLGDPGRPDFDQGTIQNQDYIGEYDMVRVFTEVKSTAWQRAELDASPKGGQVFFNQQAGAETPFAVSPRESVQTFAQPSLGEIISVSTIESVQTAAAPVKRLRSFLSESVSALASDVNFVEIVGEVSQDGVFNTGRFDEARFNNVARGETASQTDTATLSVRKRLQPFVVASDSDVFNAEIGLSEVGPVNAEQVFDVRRPLIQTASSQAVLAKALSSRKLASAGIVDSTASASLKDFGELVGATENVTKSVDRAVEQAFGPVVSQSSFLGRGLAEVFDSAAVQQSSVSKRFLESVAGVDSEAFRFETVFSESAGLSDTAVKSVSRGLFEDVQTVDSESFLVSRPAEEALVLADSESVFSSRGFSQRFNVSDADIKDASKPIQEFVGSQASVSREQVLFRDLFESFSSSRSVDKRVFAELAQGVGTLDFESAAVSKQVAASSLVGDSASPVFSGQRGFEESVNPLTSARSVNSIPVFIDESVQVDAFDSFALEKQVFESFSQSDDASTLLSRLFSEDVVVADAQASALSRLLFEAEAVVDSETFRVFKVVGESAVVQRGLSTEADLTRAFFEVFEADDALRFLSGIVLEAALDLSDSVFVSLNKVLEAGVGFSLSVDLKALASAVPEAVDLRALRVAVADLSKTRRAFADLEASEALKSEVKQNQGL